MSNFLQIDPETLIDIPAGKPEFGRSAWTRVGMGDDSRYRATTPRLGRDAELSLAHWAVSAGVDAIARRLVDLGLFKLQEHDMRGNFGSGMREAVTNFQAQQGWTPNGMVGRDTARALFTPLINRAEEIYRVPDRLLGGLLNHESGGLDPGAVGYYIFYPEFRGVDRGLAQINSKQRKAVTWAQAFDPVYSITAAGKGLRETVDDFHARYPAQPAPTVWQAAVCAHNSPARAETWMKNGFPSADAASYVDKVLKARYR